MQPFQTSFSFGFHEGPPKTGNFISELGAKVKRLAPLHHTTWRRSVTRFQPGRVRHFSHLLALGMNVLELLGNKIQSPLEEVGFLQTETSKAELELFCFVLFFALIRILKEGFENGF